MATEQKIKLFTKATETYVEVFGKLPDLGKRADVNELNAIYCDLCYTYENIMERQNRK